MTVTTPCKDCGKPVVVTVDAQGRRLVLDAEAKVYGAEFDFEERVAFYADVKGTAMVEHKAVCRKRPG